MPSLITPLPLEKASAIVDGAIAAGRENDMMPLTVVVLDAGGHMLVMKRADGCGIMRTDVAVGKAYGALGLGVPTRMLGERLADRPSFLGALAAASQGRFIPVPGGVLICEAGRTVIGAVGISGDTSDKDEYCAITAIASVGYMSFPPEPAADWQGSKL